ncbi:MAG: hypothetical protein ACLS44_08270 [Christensenellales bacterium]
MAIKGGKPYLAYTPLSHYIFCPVVKVVSTQFPPCVPAEIALISTLTRQVCTYQRLTYLLTLSTYRCADLTSILLGLSSAYPEFINATFTNDLQTITLLDKTSTEVLNLFKEEL